MPDKSVRDERASHQCACTHVHWYQQTYPAPGCVPYSQPQIWYGTVTSGGVTTISDVSSVAAGDASTYSVSISN